MHTQVQYFVRSCISAVPPERMATLSVLEIGSYDVNGSVRTLFPGAHYHGIDRVPGPGVDVVCEAKDFDAIVPFDIVVSTEAAEHTPDPGDIVRAAYRSLRPGGLFILTCAAEPRAAHSCLGGPFVPVGEHYRNVDPLEVWHMLSDPKRWLHVNVQHDREHGDLRVSAVKA